MMPAEGLQLVLIQLGGHGGHGSGVTFHLEESGVKDSLHEDEVFVSGGPGTIEVERRPFRALSRKSYGFRHPRRRRLFLPPSVNGEWATVVIEPWNQDVAFEPFPEYAGFFGFVFVVVGLEDCLPHCRGALIQAQAQGAHVLVRESARVEVGASVLPTGDPEALPGVIHDRVQDGAAGLVFPRGLGLLRREAPLWETHPGQVAQLTDRLQEVWSFWPLSIVCEVQKTHSLMPVNLNPIGAIFIDHEAVWVLVFDRIGKIRRPSCCGPVATPAGPAKLWESRIQAFEESRINCPSQVGVQVLPLSEMSNFHIW